MIVGGSAFGLLRLYGPILSQVNDAKRFSYESIDALTAQNLKGLQANGPEYAANVKERALGILKRSQISSTAFSHYALTALLEKNQPLDSKVLNHAFKLNARDRGVARARLILAQQSNDFDVMFEQVQILYRLDNKNRADYDIILSGMLQNPSGRALIERAASEKPSPPWFFTLLTQQIARAKGKSLLSLKDLIDAYSKSSKNLHRANLLYKLYVSKLIENEEFDAVESLWFALKPELDLAERRKRFAPYLAETTDLLGQENVFFNPYFDEIETVEQFNWRLINTRDISSDLQSQGGLFISFRGKNDSIGLRQFFFPSSPSLQWQFSVLAEHTYNADKGAFYGQIRCAADNRVMAQIQFSQSLYYDSVFTVPLSLNFQDCPLAYFDLRGRPGIFAQPINMIIHAMTLSPSL